MPALPTLLDLPASGLVQPGPEVTTALLKMAEHERADPGMCVPAGEVEAGMFGNGQFAKQDFGVQVFVRRLGTMQPGLSYSGYLLGALAPLMGHHPGTAVLYAHAAAAYGARSGQPATVLGLFVKTWDGRLPSATGLRATWEHQKISLETLKQLRQANARCPDNWLDLNPAWEPDALKAGRVQAERPNLGATPR